MTFPFDLSPWELVGLLGAGTYCLSFWLTARDLITSCSATYYAMKLAGASLILISLAEDFNLTILVLQGFYLTVSIYGLARHLHGRARAPRLATS